MYTKTRRELSPPARKAATGSLALSTKIMLFIMLRAGIEPATRGFSVHCSTTELSQQDNSNIKKTLAGGENRLPARLQKEANEFDLFLYKSGLNL